jgi:hypothetical protein
MQGTGDQLLAGPGLAADQHRQGEAGDPADLPAELRHGGRFPDQAETGQPGGGDRGEPREQQDHPVREEENDAPLHLFRGERPLVGEMLAVGGHGSPAAGTRQADRARLRSGEQMERTAAQMGVRERARLRPVRRHEIRLDPGEELLAATAEPGEQGPLAHPLQIGVVEKGQPGKQQRRGRPPLISAGAGIGLERVLGVPHVVWHGEILGKVRPVAK